MVQACLAIYPKPLKGLSCTFQGICSLNLLGVCAPNYHFSNMSFLFCLISIMQACPAVSSLTAERIKLKFSKNVPSDLGYGVSIERKCPYMKKIKGAWELPLVL